MRCDNQPGSFVQWCCFFLLGLLGMSLMLLTFSLGCFVHGADIRVALIVYFTVINITALTLLIADKGLTAGDYEEIAVGTYDVAVVRWRIVEAVLKLVIFLGGSFDAWLGIIVCFHKISKLGYISSPVFLSKFILTWVFLWLIITAEDNLRTCYKY